MACETGETGEIVPMAFMVVVMVVVCGIGTVPLSVTLPARTEIVSRSLTSKMASSDLRLAAVIFATQAFARLSARP
jgi:hypothetical protein